MPFDLGDVVPLTVTTYNASGTPENAGAVTLTVTLPDGTTTSPAVTAAGAGEYRVDYTPAQPGRHGVRWVATGTNASAYTDTFDIDEADPPLLMSLAKAKTQLNITDTKYDEELRDFLAGITNVFEDHCGPLVVRTYTERTGGNYTDMLVLQHSPVISVTSIVPILTTGQTHDVADMDVDGPTGIVQRLDGGVFRGPVRVTYKAGRPIMPPAIRNGAKFMIQHYWRTQLGSRLASRGRGEDNGPIPGMNYLVPNRVMETLTPFLRGPDAG